jgi:hypothetical protein
MVSAASLAVIEKCKLLETSTEINQCLDGIIQDANYAIKFIGVVFLITLIPIVFAAWKYHKI